MRFQDPHQNQKLPGKVILIFAKYISTVDAGSGARTTSLTISMPNPNNMKISHVLVQHADNVAGPWVTTVNVTAPSSTIGVIQSITQQLAVVAKFYRVIAYSTIGEGYPSLVLTVDV